MGSEMLSNNIMLNTTENALNFSSTYYNEERWQWYNYYSAGKKPKLLMPQKQPQTSTLVGDRKAAPTIAARQVSTIGPEPSTINITAEVMESVTDYGWPTTFETIATITYTKSTSYIETIETKTATTAYETTETRTLATSYVVTTKTDSYAGPSPIIIETDPTKWVDIISFNGRFLYDVQTCVIGAAWRNVELDKDAVQTDIPVEIDPYWAQAVIDMYEGQLVIPTILQSAAIFSLALSEAISLRR
jgi:hypothetical protein